jgi:GPH family glycoside/pentoside/hexuronide:cation symporter
MSPDHAKEGNLMRNQPQKLDEGRLSIWTKLVYGSGDWGMASFNTLRQIFYIIFLVDVVGLEPRLASLGVFVGIIWDAINDPLVGALSDRVRTRWGRRRPFLLFFAIPFGLAFLIMWWAPPWQNQVVLLIHVTLAFMISDTLQTLIVVPFLSLTPELTEDYDERTSLSGYSMIFNLVASIVTAMAAPEIQDAMISAGSTAQQGYLVTAALFGGLAALPFLLMFFVLRERKEYTETDAERPGMGEIIRTLWANVPFRFAALFYMLNWITFDLVALVLPFYLVYWVARGDLLAKANLFGIELAIESAVLGILLIIALVAIPLWTWISRRFDKRRAYIGGMVFWAVVQLFIFSIPQGEITLVLWMALLAGISVSTAHVMPEAIFPDVMEWDELLTRKRREGIYYGSKNFLRKLASAFATSLALQVLGWFGYQSPPADVTQFAQTPRALNAIRFLIGPVGALLLIASVISAWFYPLSRGRHARVRRLLARRRGMDATRE